VPLIHWQSHESKLAGILKLLGNCPPIGTIMHNCCTTYPYRTSASFAVCSRLFSFVIVSSFFAQCTLAPGALFEAPSRKQPSRNCLQGHDRYGQGRETSVNSRLQCSKCYSNVWYICFIMFPCSNKVPPPVKTLHHLHTVLCRFSFFQLRDSCLYETLFKSFQVFHMCSITSGTLAQRPRGLFLHWSKTGCMAIPRVCD
jgi:hypothetical protein